MTCQETQGYITPFINNELDSKHIEDFLYHIEHCDECKEELEVYFMLLTGMRELDEDKSNSNDFHQLLVNKLRKEEDHIVRKKISFIRKRIVLIILICTFVIFSGMGIREFVVEETSKIEETAIKSDFRIRNYFFENKTTELDQYVNNNKNDILKYKQRSEKANEHIDKGETDEKENSIN